MRPTNRTAYGVLVCLALLAASPSVRAGPIAVDSGWQAFNWAGAPGVFSGDGPFTFSSTSTSQLKVTDAFVSGDIFEVYDNGSLIGTTSLINGYGLWTADPDAAYGNSGFSWGQLTLAAGSHSLEFKTINTPTGYASGTGYFRVDSLGSSHLPEPASIALAALGAAGLTLGARRRRRPSSS